MEKKKTENEYSVAEEYKKCYTSHPDHKLTGRKKSTR